MDQAKPRKHIKNRKKDRIRMFSIRSGIDLPFLGIVLLLVVIGLVMMFSASFAYARYNVGDSYYFIKQQSIFAVLGVAAMLVISFFDYRVLHKSKWVYLGLLLSYVLLVIVLFMPARNGAKRWINLGSGTFQPSEITKFVLVMVYAHLMSINYNKMGKFTTGILPYILIFGSTAALLILEPHLSCIMIMFMLTVFMLWVGGVKKRWFLILGVVLAAVLYVALFTDLVPYAGGRIDVWRDPFGYPDKDLSHQTRQSLYAISSGGFLGVGLGNSRQKYLYLPEPQNDFIFAIICEELGFVGAVIIMVIFALLIWRGFVIALHAPDRFGCLLGMGLTAQVGLQVILNICVVTNSLPNTGISLPFFSYGGTSLCMLLAEMGLILSISRSSKMEKS